MARRPGKATRTTSSNLRRISRPKARRKTKTRGPIPIRPITYLRKSDRARARLHVARSAGGSGRLRHHQPARLRWLQSAHATERHRRAQRRPHACGSADDATHDRRLRDARAATDPRAARRISRAGVTFRHRCGDARRSHALGLDEPRRHLALDVAAGNVSPGEQQAAPCLLERARPHSDSRTDQRGAARQSARGVVSIHGPEPELARPVAAARLLGSGCFAAAADRGRDHPRAGRLGQAGAIGGGVGMTPRRRTHNRQRGVALIMAVLIVALATMLAASVSFKGYLDQRRSANAFALDQGFEVALGGEAWAADSLRRDKQQSAKTDDFTEEWATPIPPIPIDNGQFEGQMEDMQGRFNLNSLVTLEGGQFKFDQPAIDRFERLLELLELETKWARIIADWIDSDIQPNFPDGAEDPTYTGLSPPYRTANMPLTRASELLAITGFGLERYRKLEPFVTALPIGTSINLCTASPELLDALVAGRRQFTLARETTMETRKERCFPTVDDYKNGGLTVEQTQELVQ